MAEEKKVADYGYIKVWGFKWLDNGHQRTAITYVPVSENEEYYPLTEYTMSAITRAVSLSRTFFASSV